MKLIDINSFVPHIRNAPHRFYIIELSFDELNTLQLAAKDMLKAMLPFSNIDESTNVSVVGLDGDKGAYSHANVTITHGIIMDFRPLVIQIVFWNKPGASAKLKPHLTLPATTVIPVTS